MVFRSISAFGFVIILLLQYLAPTSARSFTMRNVPDTKPQVEKTQREAERIWEQAVVAKGGRERLYAVSNAVVSSTGSYTTSRNRKNKIRQEEFYLFPDKFWAWSDYRPDVFDLRVEMVNYETNTHYIITPTAPHDEGRGMPSAGRAKIMEGQLYYLLETKWLKPVIVKANTGNVGGRWVDIIETKVNDGRIDFAFDKETHLPVSVSYFSVYKNQTFVTVENLSDYTEVSGIKVPQTIIYDDGMKYKQTFQFNVDYNPEIFVKLPTTEAGPEAWRPKKQ